MFDADRLTAAQQRNLDAFASASQIVVDGVKAMAQRQSEMMQASVDQFVAAGQGVQAAGVPARRSDRDRPSRCTRTAVNNARELAEIAMKAQSEAVDVLTKCAMANIDDLKSLAKTA